MSFTMDATVLQRLSSSMLSVARKFAGHAPPSTLASAPLFTPPTALTLPNPQPLIPRLTALGLDQSAADLISSTFAHVVTRLKHDLEEAYRRRYRALEDKPYYFRDPKFAHRISTAFLTIYSKALHTWTTYILQQFVPNLLRVRALYDKDNAVATSCGLPSSKRPFNQNAVPILERFFSENAFPSRLEKYTLATQCDMSYRQIDVWFQNHRSRYKKDGKGLPRRDRNDPLVEEIEKVVVDTLLPISFDEGDVSDPSSRGSLLPNCTQSQSPSFNLEAPAHAFPTPYPPACSYDPFPATQEKRNLKLPWIRSSSPISKTVDDTVDLSTLIIAFTKLVINDEGEHHRQHSPETHCLQERSSPAGIITYCFPAPLPSLIRAAVPVPTPSHPSRSTAARNCPTEATSTKPSCQPKRTLPRRIPQTPFPRPTLHHLVPHSPSRRFTTVSGRAPSLTPVSSRSSSVDCDSDSSLPTPPHHSITLPFDPPKPVLDADGDDRALISSAIARTQSLVFHRESLQFDTVSYATNAQIVTSSPICLCV